MSERGPIIEGSGKGGHTPTEAPDSLFSNNIGHVIDLISEGECEGIVGDRKGIFYNEIALEDGTGTANFKGVVVNINNGTPTQPALPGQDNVKSTVGVSQALPYNTPKSISFVNNSTFSSVIVQISAAQFFEVTKDGDTVGTSVTFTIERSQNGGAFQQIYSTAITGKQTTEVTFDYRIPITDPTGNTAIRVTRTKADSASLKINDVITFKNYTKVLEHKLNYPNCATAGHVIDAKQFGNQIPTRQYRFRGIKCKVPANYNATTRVYTGAFTGALTSTKVWTNNPAWIFYELVTNKRYGLGKFFDPALVDIPSLYQVGKWCDDAVSNGSGGTEPRWTCNTTITTRGDAFNVLKELVSCFRGNLFWMQAKLWAIGDAPKTPVKIVTNANVVDGKFTYSGESNRNRYSVVNVAFNDPDLFFRRGIEPVENKKLIRELGYKPTDFGAFGCTSRAQARRLGKAILFSQEFESEMLSYQASYDHMAVDTNGPQGLAPGDLIIVSDRERGNAVAGGRVISVAGSAVTVDRDTGSGSGTFYVEHSDGTMEWLTCTYSGAVVTLTQTPVTAVNSNDLFVLIATGYSAEEFVVLKITETEPHLFDISAVKYDPARIAAIYSDQVIDKTNYMSVASARFCAPPVGPLAFTEGYIYGADFYSRTLSIGWTTSPDPLLDYYIVSYSKDNDNWVTLPIVGGNVAKIENARAGVYNVQVVAMNKAGVSSLQVSGTYTVGVVPSTAILPAGTIAGLALQSGGTSFSGKDAPFKWTVTSPTQGYLNDQGITANTGFTDPSFRDCLVTVVKTDGVTVLRSESIVDTFYTYTYEKNYADNSGTPVRSFILQVQYRDIYGRTSTASSITVSNTAPTWPSPPSVVPAPDGIIVNAPIPTDPDFNGMKVYMSLSTPVALTGGNLVYNGKGTLVTLPKLSSALHYVVAVPTDTYGDGTASSEFSVTPSSATNTTQMSLTNEDVSVPSASDGSSPDFTYATGQVQLFSGTTDVTASATLSAPTVSSGLTFQINTAANTPIASQPKGYYRATGLSVDNGSATIQAVYSGVTVQKTFTIAKSKAGATGTSPKLMYLVSDTQQIKYTGAGALVASQTVNFTATRQNTAVATTWKIFSADGTDRTAALATYLSTSGDTASMTGAQFDAFLTAYTTTGITVVAQFTDGVTLSDKVSIIKTQDGATGAAGVSALVGFLTNEDVTLAADSTGTVASYSTATGNFRVFSGTTDVSSSFSLTTQANPNTLTMSYSGQTYSVTAGLTVDQASVTIRATGSGAYAGITIDKVLTLARSKTGSTGLNAKTVIINSNRQTVAYNNLGVVVASQTTTFSAQKQNTTGTVTWTMVDTLGNTLTASSYLSATTGDSVTMTETQFNSAITVNGAKGVIVTGTITADSISDKISVLKVQDGANAPNAIIQFSTDGTGTGGGTWHVQYATGDKFWRQSVDGGSTYTTAAQITASDLASLDATAAAKLAGISTGAGTVLTLIAGGTDAPNIARLSLTGNSYTRTNSTDNYNSWVTSAQSYARGAMISCRLAGTSRDDVFIGFSETSSPSSLTAMKFGVYWYADGAYVYVVTNGVNTSAAYGTGVSGALGHPVITCTTDDLMFRVYFDGVEKTSLAQAIPAGKSYFAMFSGYAGGVKDIIFTPNTTNNFAAIGGSTKPADNATVGSTVGVDFRRSGGTLASGDTAVFNDQIGLSGGKITNVASSLTGVYVDNSVASISSGRLLRYPGDTGLTSYVDNGYVVVASGRLSVDGGSTLGTRVDNNYVVVTAAGDLSVDNGVTPLAKVDNSKIGFSSGKLTRWSGDTALTNVIDNQYVQVRASDGVLTYDGGTTAVSGAPVVDNQKQTWAPISGAGKPADYADVALTLSALGPSSVTRVGNTLTNTSGGTGYGASVVSQAIPGGTAYAAMDIPAGANLAIVVIDDDNTTYDYATQLAYAYYRTSDGAFSVYSNGTVLTSTALASGLTGQLEVRCNGVNAEVWVAGVLRYSFALTPTGPLYAKFYAYTAGSTTTGFRAGSFDDLTRQQRFNTYGQAVDSRVLTANANFGLRSLKDAPTFSDTDNTGSVTLNIGSMSYYSDWGSTITFPSGSVAGCAYNTQFFIYRTGVDPVNAPTGTGWSASTSLSVATSSVYVGYYTTRATGGTPSPPPPPPPPGGSTCVAADAWVETRDRGFVEARDIRLGDYLRVLTDDREDTRWEPCTGNSIARSEAVRLVAGGKVLTVAASTPITLRDGTITFAPLVDGLELPTFDLKLQWESCSVESVGEIEVAHIHCSGATYAAGDKKGLSILTHNPIKP